MSDRLSLTLRAVLAVGLMIGFYVLAIGVAGALIAVPFLGASVSQSAILVKV
jgi:hypothetical protein